MTQLPRYLNKRQLTQRGWSETSIAKFLGKPVVEREHPETGALVPFWSTEDALFQEKSKAWNQWKTRKELMDIIEKSAVTINKMDLDAVKFAAVNDYNHLHIGEERFHFATVNSEPSFLDRVVVNYLRHKQTNYDNGLKIIARKTGKEQAYALLKNKVLTEISRAYPSLQEECIRQRVSIQDVLSRIS